MTPNAPWPQEEIEYANRILSNGGFPSDVTYRVNRKFKNGRSLDAVRRAIHDGVLIGRVTHKKKSGGKITSGYNSFKALAYGYDSNGGRVFIRDKKYLNEKRDHDVDPIADVGFALVDLQANQCHWPVARWPKKYPQQRFCGARRESNGRYFTSPYCPEHHATARLVPFCEAAE